VSSALNHTFALKLAKRGAVRGDAGVDMVLDTLNRLFAAALASTLDARRSR
jgi:hypothetical protein